MQQEQTWHQKGNHPKGDPEGWEVKGSVELVLAGGSLDESAFVILL
jgi:hypothetical protein